MLVNVEEYVFILGKNKGWDYWFMGGMDYIKGGRFLISKIVSIWGFLVVIVCWC